MCYTFSYQNVLYIHRAVFCTFRIFIKIINKTRGQTSLPGLIDVLLQSLIKNTRKYYFLSYQETSAPIHTHHLHGHFVAAAGSVVEGTESVDVNGERRTP